MLAILKSARAGQASGKAQNSSRPPQPRPMPLTPSKRWMIQHRTGPGSRSAHDARMLRIASTLTEGLRSIMKFQFHPKLLDTLPGCGKAQFTHDVSAGLTVGVLALPLAMAFAIASGMSPTAGIWTSIVAGLLISLLGGSRVQIGGPTGAFIPIIYAIVMDYGCRTCSSPACSQA